jgi:multiple sugar transport system ATP-binding protein
MDEPLSNLDAKLRIQTRAEILRIQRRLHTTTVYVTHDQVEAMTLGDRLVVMRDGVMQQVGTPHELYDTPRNIFVAGFIGSPAMNFLPGTVTNGSLEFPLATVPLDGVDAAGKVVVGLRPEAFEDAALIGDRKGGITIDAKVDVMESTGSDIYAHLALNGAAAPEELGEQALKELEAAATSSNEGVSATSLDVVARLDTASRVAEGKDARLWLDTSKLHLFDPQTGERLTS